MLTKILFTLLVAVGVIAAARVRARQVRERPPPAPVEPATPAWLPRAFGIGFAVLVLAGSSLYYYLQWSDDHRVIHIRVIDTRSGDTSTYKAYKGDISGRSFQTLEGWKVTVSDAERVEMVEE